jgi:16S rRNA A1518/A1519 N6-dimethyltransferase RsmA/KsgA/DIM1 with predicted DNA glycosylase/AP lyase activity
VKAGFAHKRKMLLGNLRKEFGNKNLEAVFSEIGIDIKIRAEDISLEQWKKLTQKLS